MGSGGAWRDPPFVVPEIVGETQQRKTVDLYPPAIDFLHPIPSHLAISETPGVSVHRKPKPINKVDGHGRCGRVGEEEGVRPCTGGGVWQGGSLQRGFRVDERRGSAIPRYQLNPHIS